MLNKKIELQDVQDGTLDSTLHFQTLKRQFKAMEDNCIDPTSACDFALSLEQEFDKKTVDDTKNVSVEFLMIIGTSKGSEWRVYLKEQAKKNKKKFLMGTCYLKDETIYLIPERGAAPIRKIKMAGKRLFNRIGIAVELEPGMVIEEDEIENDQLENGSTADESKETIIEKTDAEKISEAKILIQELADIQLKLKGLLDRFKELAKESDTKTLVAIVGEIKIHFNSFKLKIEDLRKNGLAKEQLIVFEKNLSSLETTINERLSKFDTAIGQVRKFTLDLVSEINQLLDTAGFDSQQRLKF